MHFLAALLLSGLMAATPAPPRSCYTRVGVIRDVSPGWVQVEVNGCLDWVHIGTKSRRARKGYYLDDRGRLIVTPKRAPQGPNGWIEA